MTEQWYWKLGFATNPFSIKPAVLTNDVVGHNIEPILNKIEDGTVQFVEAPLGWGKTTILKSIISKFGGNRKLIYCSCIEEESLYVEDLLKNATLKGKLFGKLGKDMILMVDEAQNISKEDAQEINNFKTQGEIKSVAFFGTEYNKNLLPDELNKSLNGNVTVLSYLTPEDAIELVRKRVANLKLLPDYVIREIYGRSSGNPRLFLQECEELCRKAVELSINELAVTDVGTLLQESEIVKKPKKTVEIKEQVVKAKKTIKISKPTLTKPKKTVAKVKAKNVKARKVKTSKVKKTELTVKEPEKTTVTYSGYNLENIRTYEEEMGTSDKRTD